LAGELFKVSAGIDMTHVPYNGSSPALTALIGNQVQAMFDVVLTSNPHIKSGKLRALGVTGSKRIPLLPEVPTVSEAGLPGYEAGIWFAMVAPKATAPAIVQRLNQELTKILKLPEMRARFDALALELLPTSPEEVAAYAAKEQGRWAKLIKEKGIRLD
jgi:tripartite-type tricarboxylate transporter receptor subunit TctC